MTGKICGTGSWAPDRVWDNNDLAKMVETSDQWIRERTGVVQRHIAKEDEDTAVSYTHLDVYKRQHQHHWHTVSHSVSDYGSCHSQ